MPRYSAIFDPHSLRDQLPPSCQESLHSRSASQNLQHFCSLPQVVAMKKKIHTLTMLPCLVILALSQRGLNSHLPCNVVDLLTFQQWQWLPFQNNVFITAPCLADPPPGSSHKAIQYVGLQGLKVFATGCLVSVDLSAGATSGEHLDNCILTSLSSLLQHFVLTLTFQTRQVLF